ncbi:Plasma membrane-associated cation-binding protein 1 [Linum grandiflorum]
MQTVVKEPTEAGLKKHSTSVVKFFEELVKIEFPGSKVVSEACSKYGPAYVSGPVFFIFEKVSTFIPVEEKPAEEATAVVEAKEKEIVVEETPAPAEAEKAAAETEPAAATTTAAAAEEPPAKVEETAAAAVAVAAPEAAKA